MVPIPDPPPTPDAVGAGKLLLPGTIGRGTGNLLGVNVELPRTISGILAEPAGAGVMVEEPLRVAVYVVKTSVSVVVLRGKVVVGLVVGAKEVAAANAPPEKNMVVDVVTFETCATTVGTIVSPPPEQVENPKNSMKDCSPSSLI